MVTKVKKYIKSIVAGMMTTVLCLGNFGAAVNVMAITADMNATTTSNIWIIGDSTVSSFTDNYYYPRYGWGTQIGNYLDGSFIIQNLALSGRSSKSYTADPEYKTLTSGMKNGDYLLVGFGHNDEKSEAERYTNPNGTYLDKGSFANSLYENYIKPAEAAGTKVILATPIVRRTDTGVWSDSNLHITATSGAYAGGDYAKAIRDLGTALNIPVVDMTSLTKSLYEKLGPDETLNLHAWTSSKSASVDNTHTNIWGAKYNAYLITKTIKELGVSGLAEHVINATAPTKADSLVSNPNYKESAYTGELPQSMLWLDYGIWKGTAFGNLAGAPNTTNQVLGKDSNGNMHIAVSGDKGKIASTVDGLAMYYYKVPASSTFTLTAKAKINRFTLNDQVSFGLMARDEMYTDYNTIDALGDYVAAAPLKLTKTGAVWNSFARKSGVLTQGGTCKNTISAGDTINLSIQSNSDGYAATFGNEATITGGFDFKLTSIDPNYVYVGMFVARNADITFSDIKLVIDGVDITNTSTTTVDKTALQQAIAAAQAKYDVSVIGTEAGQYPEIAKTALQTAITTAKGVNDNTSATAAEVSKAVEDINTAVTIFDAAKIVQIVVDKTALNTAITTAQAKYDAAVIGTEAGQYPEITKTALQTAITTAKGVNDNTSATTAQVSKAVEDLNAAVTIFDAAKIVQIVVDKTALNTAITTAQAKYDAAVIGTEAGQYSEIAKTALQTAIATAKAINNNTSATAAQVSKAIEDLNTAVIIFDAAKIVQTVEDKTEVNTEIIPVTTSKLDNTDKAAVISAINDAIKNSKDVLVVDITKSPVVSRDILNAMKGQDKTVTFEGNNISWTFNGKGIANAVTTDMDLSLKTVSDSLKSKETAKMKAVTGKDVAIVPFSFSYDGELPTIATVKVFVSKDLANKTVDIFRYYSDNNTYETIQRGLIVDGDGYVTFTIDHCSDYFVVDAATVDKLPQTGAFMDTKMLVCIGGMLSMLGAAMFVVGRRKNKEII
jgi:hypothetical protein